MEKVRRRGKLVYFIEIKNPRRFWSRIYEKTVCFRKTNMPFEKVKTEIYLFHAAPCGSFDPAYGKADYLKNEKPKKS